MIRLLKFLFTGDWHLHKWKIIANVPYSYKSEYSQTEGTRRVCQCEHCGTIRNFDP
jgi:hypothetical protein